MGRCVTGLVHVHSDFSRDGLCSVKELAGFAREAGFGFVGITDHAEDLSDRNIEALCRECEAHSDELLVMIPGLEFRCGGGLHILGLGVRQGIGDREPVRVASWVRNQGGVAVLAHPSVCGHRYPSELRAALDGIEIWNARYDGHFVPAMANLRLLEEVRQTNPTVAGFGGADLHTLEQHPGVTLELQVQGRSNIHADIVLEHLRQGKFAVCGRYLRLHNLLPARGLTRGALWAFRKSYELSKAIRDAACVLL